MLSTPMSGSNEGCLCGNRAVTWDGFCFECVVICDQLEQRMRRRDDSPSSEET